MIINIPDNWLPTSENINALPRPVRDYIMRLHANTDPAGEFRRAMVAEMERDALRKMMEWQPIETAPVVEGSIVLLWDDEALIGELHDLRWRVYLDGQSIWSPTHWMPLPEAPDAV